MQCTSLASYGVLLGKIQAKAAKSRNVVQNCLEGNSTGLTCPTLPKATIFPTTKRKEGKEGKRQEWKERMTGRQGGKSDGKRRQDQTREGANDNTGRNSESGGQPRASKGRNARE